MAIKLFVAGLPYAVTSDELQSMFADYGTVASAQVVTDRDTGRLKGFGFVEFDSDDEGNAAIAGLNGKHTGRPQPGRQRGRPREDRPNRPAVMAALVAAPVALTVTAALAPWATASAPAVAKFLQKELSFSYGSSFL